MIKDIDRKKFTYAPETFLKGKKIMVTETVINYKDKTEIIVTKPDQIKILD
jgi:DNA/RNA endonuclease YhcR with UshA esterase domain